MSAKKLFRAAAASLAAAAFFLTAAYGQSRNDVSPYRLSGEKKLAGPGGHHHRA